MVFYGTISSFLAVIDPNSFGLVSSDTYMHYQNVITKPLLYKRTFAVDAPGASVVLLAEIQIQT